MTNADTVSVLKLTLHRATVGYLAGYRDGRTILTFAPEFASNAARPTFSLITHPDFPKAAEIMAKPWFKQQKLHPALSNLLPEGALRDYLAQVLKATADFLVSQNTIKSAPEIDIFKAALRPEFIEQALEQ